MIASTRLRTAQSGYIFPFALLVLTGLSFLLLLLAERIQRGQEHLRIAGEQARMAVTNYNIEQEIVFRALMEVFAREDVGNLLRTEYVYITRPPENEWKLRSQPFRWSGLYQHSFPLEDVAASNMLVSVQDSAGLFDMNYTRREYLQYIAEFLGIANDRINIAVDILTDYIDQDKSPGLRGDETGPYPDGGEIANTPLRSPNEICGLPEWKNIEWCEYPEILNSFLTARFGSALAIESSPLHLWRLLIPEAVPGDRADRYTAWRERQQAHGFYDPHFPIRGGRTDLLITIRAPQSQRRKRFRLQLYGLAGERPYVIFDRAYESALSSIRRPRPVQEALNDPS